MSLGIVIDERLSRERALWLTQVVKKLRVWTHVEFIKSETPPEQWAQFLAAHPTSKLLVPAHRTRETLRLEDPQRFGFYTCEPLSPNQWQLFLAAAPDRLQTQASFWNWNPGEKRLASLLLEMRAWLGMEGTHGLKTFGASENPRLLTGSLGDLIDDLAQTAQPAPARRLLLSLAEIQSHSTGPLNIEWSENESVRAMRVTFPVHGQRLPQIFTTIAHHPRLALDTNFARALWCAPEEILELTLGQYTWITSEAVVGATAPHSYWWGLAPPGHIFPVLGSVHSNTTPGQEPKLTSATLRPDAATLQENERLRALISELKSGGVGQPKAQTLEPPETRVLLEAFKQRYFESKLEIRKLEAVLSGPVADIRIAAIKKRIEDLKTQHQEWIQILTDTLAQEKKRRSS